MNVLRNESEGEEEVSPDKRVHLHFMMEKPGQKKVERLEDALGPCRKTSSFWESNSRFLY